MNTLAVYLPHSTAGVTLTYDYALIADRHNLVDHGCVSAALLPTTARAGEVVVVVPIELLSWHKVELPKGMGIGSAKLRPVLEGLLEDRLLDETTQLHLALGPAAGPGGGPVWVAACDKSWLHGHLQALETAQCRVSRVVPEFAPEAGALRMHVISDAGIPQLIITGGQAAGVMCLPLTLAALALVPNTEDDEEILMFAEPEAIELAEKFLQRKVELTTRPQRWLEATRSSWDLAQFELASSSRLRAVKRLTMFAQDLLHAPAGRPARWGFAFLVMIQLAGLNIWSWQVQNNLQTRRTAITTTLTQTFPQIKLVVDAPLQMERELVILRQTSGTLSSRDLEPVLAALGSVARTDLSLGAIEFIAGETRLKGMQLGAPEASRISEQLQRLGYAARQDGDTFFIQQVVPTGATR